MKTLTINLTVTPHVSFDDEGNTVVSEMGAIDLSPLAELTHVAELRLNVGTVEDLTPLSRMPVLRELSLVINESVDISPLVDCTALQRLVLEGSGMVDLTPLSRCAELNYLRLWIRDENGNTPDLSALSGAPKLETLVTIGHNGLSELRDVPLRRVQDIGDSDSILKELPNVDTLETVQISDRFLTDISPLLAHASVKQILLIVDGQELPQMTTITAENRELLDRLITAIPKEQLSEFLNRDGASVTIMFDMNRTSGFMVNHG